MALQTLQDPALKECIREARSRFFDGTQNTGFHYSIPFPIGVFGTLRIIPEDQGNASLMFRREPNFHCKAFLPHFTANGLSLEYKEGASAIFEVFFYDREDWKKVIIATDHLEGFCPDDGRPRHYQRTLVEMRLLPFNYAEALFNESIHPRGWTGFNPDRSLKIPEEEWFDYPGVPTWVYSNIETNLAVTKLCSEPSDPSPHEDRPSRSIFSNPVKWWR